jgi:chromosome segregation ATPase
VQIFVFLFLPINQYTVVTVCFPFLTPAEKQVAEWKQRVQSTPTQLDEMLDNFSSKNIDLEQRLESLEEEMRTKEIAHKRMVSERDEIIESVRRELSESTAAQDESRQECASMREELTALSQAYTSLEQQYRDQNNRTASAPGAGSRERDDAPIQQQSRGEDSEQVSTGAEEVATLRAENVRLRSDAQAADEWMAMAVQRLNELSSQNQTLTQEVTILSQQLESVETRIDAVAGTVGNAMTEERLRQQVDAPFVHIQQPFDPNVPKEEQDRRKAAEDALTKVTRELEYERSLRETIEGKLAQKELAILAASSDRPEELQSLRVTVDTLDAELAKTKQELEVALSKDQHESHQRETRIRELESRPSSGTNGFTMEDIQNRDKDIAELQAANSAAQEWMSKAVEHNQMLSNQVTTLTQDNLTLTHRIQSLTADLSAAEACVKPEAEFQQLEQSVKELKDEIEGAKKELALRAESLEQYKVALASSATAEKEALALLEKSASERESEVSSLRDVNESLRLTLASLEASLGGRSGAELLATIEQLEAQIAQQDDGSKTLISELQQTCASLERSRNELKLQVESLEEHRQVVNNSEEASVKTINALEDQLTDARGLVDKWKESCNDLEASRNDLLSRIDELEKQNKDILSTAVDSDSVEIKLLQFESKVTHLEDELAAQAKSASDTIAQWQESYAEVETAKIDLQARVAELDNLMQSNIGTASPTTIELETKVQELENQLISANESIQKWIESYNDSEASRLDLQSRITELENFKNDIAPAPEDNEAIRLERLDFDSKVTHLEDELAAQAKSASDTIAQWQESYAELETAKNELQTRLAEFEQTTLNSTDAPSHTTTELEAKVQELENQLISSYENTQKWIESYNTLEASGNDLQSRITELEKLKNDIAFAPEDNEAIRLERQDIESKITRLEDELAAQAKSASDTIAQWQESFVGVEARYNALQCRYDELENAYNKVLDTPTFVNGDNVSVSEKDFRSKLTHLEEQLVEQKKEASDAISLWQERYDEVEASRDALQARVLILDAELENRDEKWVVQEKEASDAITQWQESYYELEASRDALQVRVADLDVKLEHFAEQLARQELEASDAISQWQERYDEVEASRDVLQARVLLLEAELENRDEKWVVQEKEASDAITQWQESYYELEASRDALQARVADLDVKLEHFAEQLAEQEVEASDAISQWQERYDEVEASRDALQARLTMFEKAKETTDRSPLNYDADPEDDPESVVVNAEFDSKLKLGAERLSEQDIASNICSQMQFSNSEVQASHDSTLIQVPDVATNNLMEAQHVECEAQSSAAMAELHSKLKLLEEQLSEQEQEANDAIVQWQERYDEVEASRDALQARVLILDAELQNRDEKFVVQEKEASDAITRWQESYYELEASRDALQARVSDLDVKLEHLEEQLSDQEVEASDAISQWQERYDEIEDRCSSLQSRLEAIEGHETLSLNGNSDRIRELEAIIVNLTEKIEKQLEETTLSIALTASREAEFETTVLDLRNQLTTQQADAEEALTKHKDLVSTIESEKRSFGAQLKTMASEHSSYTSGLLQKIDALQAQLEEEAKLCNESILEWEHRYDKLSEANKELESTNKSLEISGVICAERAAELETELNDLQNEKEEQEKDAADAIEQWEKSYKSAETSILKLESRLASTLEHNQPKRILLLEQEIKDLKAQDKTAAKEVGEGKCDEKESSPSRVDADRDVVKEMVALKAELDDYRRESEETIKLWKGMYAFA